MSRPMTSKGRTKWARNICSWCGRTFYACQHRTATCGGRCRLNLHRFRLATGFDPESPPGKLTAFVAVNTLLQELLIREKMRRDQLAALR